MKKLFALLLLSLLTVSLDTFANAEIVIYSDATGTSVVTGTDFSIENRNLKSFIEAGDAIVVTVTNYNQVGNDYPYWQIGWGTWNGMSGVTIQDGEIEVPLTEADVTNLQNGNIQFRTNGSTSYTITKVAVKKNDSYSDLVELACNEKATENNDVKAKIYYSNCANISDGDIIVVETTANSHSNVSYYIQNLNGYSNYENGSGSFDGRDFAYKVPSGVGSTMRTKTGTNEWDNGIVIKGGSATDWFINKVYLAKRIYSLSQSSTPDFSSILQNSPVNISLTCTFKVGWNTICLPFALTSAQVTTYFGSGAKVYEYTSSNASAVTVTEVSEMTAGKPYLLKMDEAKNSITFTGVNVTATTPDESTVFKGNFIAAMNMQDKYGVTGNVIKKGASGATLKAFAGYFDFGSGAPAFFDINDGQATGINTIDLDAKHADDTECFYNLAGQRVNQPARGIFVKNGKKYIIK